jgi:hydroxymethylglutaryl-CoA lyase
VTLREVGPRDGLQAEKPLPVQDRVRLIDALSATGVAKIEAVSFVSPKAVPAMADAATVWARVSRAKAVAYSALVPNRSGAEQAVEAGGFASLQAFIAASDGYNRMNVGKTVEESMVDVAGVIAVSREAALPVEVSISAAFGDPYTGNVPPKEVADLARRLGEEGAVGVSLADTTGLATPTGVWQVVERTRENAPGLALNLHFHDTRGTAMANVWAALEAGVSEFDASIGGLGGSPFAPGVNGNVATEDLAHMLIDMGLETGIDFGKLLDAARMAQDLVGHILPGRVLSAGPKWTVSEPRELGDH